MASARMLPPQLHHAILEFFDEYRRALESLEVNRIERFWDVEDESAVYIAEEVPEPFIGWGAIARYWQGNADGMTRMAVKLDRFIINSLGPDVISVTYDLHWDAHVKGALRPVGGNVWASAIVSCTPRLHLVHYTESALGALPFLRKIYEMSVSPEFLKHKVD